MKDPKLIVIAGPSGVGKGTIISGLLNENIILSISMTTRKKREGEIEGKHYYFVTKDEFREKIKNNEFVEYEEFFNNFYGTPKGFIEKNIKEGKSVILEIETKGALNIMKKYKDGIFIFIMPPSIEELERRLASRGNENDEQIKMRIKKAKIEIEESKYFSHCIINDDLEQAIKEIKVILGD